MAPLFIEKLNEVSILRHKVAIIRHAQAEVSSDEMGRPLTDEGVKQALTTAANMPYTWQKLVCSPAVRAQQTGQYLTGLMPMRIDRLYTNHQPTWEEISTLRETLLPYISEGDCLIVTHAPLIIPLTAALIGKELQLADVKPCGGAIIFEDKSIQWVR